MKYNTNKENTTISRKLVNLNIKPQKSMFSQKMNRAIEYKEEKITLRE